MEREEKFTEGEWFVKEIPDRDLIVIRSKYRTRLADVETYAETGVVTITDDASSEPDAIYDAHLIASSPDLYEALNNLITGHENKDYELLGDGLVKARAALKKARGKS